MWNERESPLRIEKRFEFDQYSKISKFMGEIEKICKERDIYPNISFGKNFVSLSIFLENNKGKKLVAVDPVGAREGNWVFTSSGSAARFACPNPEIQTDLTIGGIIDYWESD